MLACKGDDLEKSSSSSSTGPRTRGSITATSQRCTYGDVSYFSREMRDSASASTTTHRDDRPAGSRGGKVRPCPPATAERRARVCGLCPAASALRAPWTYAADSLLTCRSDQPFLHVRAAAWITTNHSKAGIWIAVCASSTNSDLVRVSTTTACSDMTCPCRVRVSNSAR
jgi:hypothetical protein